jgi:polysaccharide chain length determinant protein (PEP-CTERM system associated)
MLGHRSLVVADYVAILKRRRLIILSFVIVCPIIGAVVTRFIPPRYMSQTLVIIEQQKVPDEYVKPVIESNLDGRLASMKEQILSRSRIQPIIEHYNLYGNTAATMDDKVDLARKAIDIKPIHSAISNASGGLPGFFIAFTSSDPHTAQLVCGEITNLFMNENLRSREASAEGTTDFLKGQLSDAKKNLDEQDAKLAAFQTQYFGKLPGEEGQNVSMMNSLNSQLDASSQQLAQMEQNKTYLESLIAQNQISMAPRPSASSSADTSPAAIAAAQTPEGQAHERELHALQQRESDLLTQYTPSYPDVVAVRRQIADLKKEIAAAAVPAPASKDGTPAVVSQANTDPPALRQLRAQLAALQAAINDKQHEEANIQSRMGLYASRIQSSPQVEEQYKELTRDYDTAQKFYDDLLTKMNHSKMATDLERRQEGEQFRVMDEPNLPDSPSWPKLSLFVYAGLLLGFGLGCALAAFLEYKDTALRTERDVWAFTRLPTLGIISVAGQIPEEKPFASKLDRFKRHTEVKPRDVKPGKDSLAGAQG